MQEAPGGGQSQEGFSEAEEGQLDACMRLVGTELEGAGQMGTLMRLAARPRPRGAAAVLAASLVRLPVLVNRCWRWGMSIDIHPG